MLAIPDAAQIVLPWIIKVLPRGQDLWTFHEGNPGRLFMRAWSGRVGVDHSAQNRGWRVFRCPTTAWSSVCTRCIRLLCTPCLSPSWRLIAQVSDTPWAAPI